MHFVGIILIPVWPLRNFQEVWPRKVNIMLILINTNTQWKLYRHRLVLNLHWYFTECARQLSKNTLKVLQEKTSKIKKELERNDLNVTSNKRVQIQSEISRLARLNVSRIFSFASYMRIERGHPSTSRTSQVSTFMDGRRPARTPARASRFYFRRQQRDSRISRTIITYILWMESFLSPESGRRGEESPR